MDSENRAIVFDPFRAFGATQQIDKRGNAINRTRLFDRIRRMQARFDALCERIEDGFAGVSEAEGMAEIEAAIAEDREAQRSRSVG